MQPRVFNTALHATVWHGLAGYWWAVAVKPIVFSAKFLIFCVTRFQRIVFSADRSAAGLASSAASRRLSSSGKTRRSLRRPAARFARMRLGRSSVHTSRSKADSFTQPLRTSSQPPTPATFPSPLRLGQKVDSTQIRVQGKDSAAVEGPVIPNEREFARKAGRSGMEGSQRERQPTQVIPVSRITQIEIAGQVRAAVHDGRPSAMMANSTPASVSACTARTKFMNSGGARCPEDVRPRHRPRASGAHARRGLVLDSLSGG